MLRYVVRRLLYGLPILIGVTFATFALFNLTATPEQIARRSISQRNPSQEQIEEWLSQHGYDQPLFVRFEHHMTDLLLFRFGRSDSTGEDIWTRIRAGVVPSLILASLVLFVGVIIDVVLALFVAYFRGTYIDVWGLFVCVLLMSISYIVYLIVGQAALGKLLKYYPISGYRGGLDAWKFLLMPTVVAVLASLGAGVRFYRTFVLEETHQEYVRTARAKGVPEERVLFGHVLKNAAIPILTSVVAQVPLLLMGSLLLESFFNIPGLGAMTVDAIFSQDFAVVRAMVFLGSVLYIIGYILTDISYALVDPRVRLG
jgi:peptide/nickel transport system permease protein